MAARPPLVVAGLMSGTSLDGVDAAVLRTDGTRILGRGAALTIPYDEPFRERLRAVLGREGDGTVAEVAHELTLRHVEAVRRIAAVNDRSGVPGPIALIGFHGHTVLHRPERRLTRQIGDPGLLARETGLPVVFDFRRQDVAAGGQGAPLAPLYHAALVDGLPRPLGVLNVGGIANLTWIGDSVIAFDTGPGNALIDDWVRAATGRPYDAGGALARRGTVDAARLGALLDNPYFDRPPPKSLDRGDFAIAAVAGLAPADGAATLTAFTAAAVARALPHLPAPPARWLVTGGGRHNATLMAALGARIGAAVEPVEAMGWDGDAIEAQAFAFLAVRSLYGLPLSLPSTTGVARPMPGGILFPAPGRAPPRAR